MIKELYTRFPKALFYYRIARSICAAWGGIWFFVGVYTLFTSFGSWMQVIAFKQAFTLLWFCIIFFSVMGCAYYVKISRIKNRKEPILPNDGFQIDHSSGNVEYELNPDEDWKNLMEAEKQVRGFEFWQGQLKRFSRKPFKQDERYKKHRCKCLNMKRSTKHIYELNPLPR